MSFRMVVRRKGEGEGVRVTRWAHDGGETAIRIRRDERGRGGQVGGGISLVCAATAFFFVFSRRGRPSTCCFVFRCFLWRKKGRPAYFPGLALRKAVGWLGRCWFLVGRVDSNDIYLLAVLTAASSRFEFSSCAMLCHVKRVRGGLPNLRFIWTTLIFSVQ